MNVQQLFSDPRYRKLLAAGGIGAAALLAVIAKRKTAAKTTGGGTVVSAVPPANPPVDTNADAIGNALAGLTQATASLQDAATNLSTTPAATLPGGSGNNPSAGPAYQPFSDPVTKTNAPPRATGLDPITRA